MCRRLVWPLLSTMLVSQMHLHWVEPEKMRRVSVWASRLQEKILKAIAQAHQTEWCSNDSGGVKKDVIHPNEAVYLKEVSDYLRLLWVYKEPSPLHTTTIVEQSLYQKKGFLICHNFNRSLMQQPPL